MVLGEHFTSSTPFHIFNAAGVRCLEGTVASPSTTIGLQGLASGCMGFTSMAKRACSSCSKACADAIAS